MKYLITLQNFKTLLTVAGIVIGVWFYKDWQFQKSENIRQTENASQLRKADSLKFTSQNLTSREILEYLQYSNPDLTKKLKADNVKLNRIESIVSQNFKYRDTATKEIDLQKIINAIKSNIPTSTPVIDSTKCLTIKGFVKYENDSLKLKITERVFNNKTDAVAYWERQQWSFLGIKTRFLGKKQFTAKTYNDCGESTIMKIEKNKE